jgi:RNA polymerase sigma-70 factor, ECF subfamily
MTRDPEDVSETDVVDLDSAEVTLRRTTVRAALARLTTREREIIALKFHAGMTNAELARMLGVSQSNAGTMLFRAMEKLRKACDETA